MLLDFAEKKRVSRPHPWSDDTHEMLDIAFIISNAEEHGLRRTDPQHYSCECGCELTPARLDEGDREKASWPNCKSWRNGGRKRCPECNSRFMPPREQYGRQLGYAVRSKDDYSDKVTEARKRRAIEQYGDTCAICREPGEEFHHIVPHRFYGIGDPPNLIPICEKHHRRGRTTFLNIEDPAKWHRFEGLSWENYLKNAIQTFTKMEKENSDEWASSLTELLERGQSEPHDPYWDAERNESLF